MARDMPLVAAARATQVVLTRRGRHLPPFAMLFEKKWQAGPEAQPLRRLIVTRNDALGTRLLSSGGYRRRSFGLGRVDHLTERDADFLTASRADACCDRFASAGMALRPGKLAGSI
jgi:hypothetical protein